MGRKEAEMKESWAERTGKECGRSFHAYTVQKEPHCGREWNEEMMNRYITGEGPDLSAHQGIVDMKRIRDAGYRMAGLRMGYGRNNVDQQYAANADACYHLGMSVVLYWFSYAYTAEMAAAEAGYAVAQAGKYWKNCPIAFDFEYDSVNYARKNGVDITKQLATDMANAFLTHVRDAGYLPVLYGNRDYLRNYFDLGRIEAAVGKVYIWYARYNAELSEEEREAADIWQYTSGGRVPGVQGNVDLNWFYADFDKSMDRVPREEKQNINIRNFQAAARADGIRDENGNELTVDGIDGPKTQYVRRKILLKAKKSGRKYVAGSSGNVVKWWQRRCNEILGRRQVEDGLFGQNARNDTLALQWKLCLKADGIAGYNSIQAVFYN